MKLIIGGSFQGKTDWARESYGIETIAYAGRCKREEMARAQAVSGIHLLVKELLDKGKDEERGEGKDVGKSEEKEAGQGGGNFKEREIWKLFQELFEKNPEVILIGDEVGLGIVPMDASDREWREAVGRLYCGLAKQASEVVRVCCGIGSIIKKDAGLPGGREKGKEMAQSLTVELIRHGKTKGNAEGRYVGTTDEELSGEGIGDLLIGKKNGSYRSVERVYISPMLRCVQTADLLYPGAERIVVPDLRECGFGEFEYKNYAELNGNPDYQKFIDSGGECAFPGGETKKEFIKRCADAFQTLVKQAAQDGKKAIAVVAHGGTVMAVMDRFSSPGKEYFCWQVKNGSGFSCLAELKDGGLTMKALQKTGPDGTEEYR